MAQSHILGKGGVLGDRQDTTGRLDPVIGYDHGTIMQRAVLKEYILDQAGIYIGVEHLARMLINRQVHILLDHDQGTRLFPGHIHTSQDNRGDKLPFFLRIASSLGKKFP